VLTESENVILSSRVALIAEICYFSQQSTCINNVLLFIHNILFNILCSMQLLSLCSACVQCVMTYGSEGEGYASSGESRQDDNRMCGVALRNGKTSEEISKRLAIVSVSDMVCQ
jgi:hypothetical protein